MNGPRISVTFTPSGVERILLVAGKGERDTGLELLGRAIIGIRLLDLQSHPTRDRAGGKGGQDTDE